MSEGYESWASSAAARATMRGNRRRDTKPELAVRRSAHALGLRYRVDVRPLAGLNRHPFTRERVAVVVDCCYWHGCPDHGTAAKANVAYWGQKIQRERDRDTDQRLAVSGWAGVRVWEHDDPRDAAEVIAEVLRARRHGTV